MHKGAKIENTLGPSANLETDNINAQILEKLLDTNNIVHQNATFMARTFEKAILPISTQKVKITKYDTTIEKVHVKRFRPGQPDGPLTPAKRVKLTMDSSLHQEKQRTDFLIRISKLENQVNELSEKAWPREMHQIWEQKMHNFVGACTYNTALSFSTFITTTAGVPVMQLMLINKHFNREMYAEIEGKYALTRLQKPTRPENKPTRFVGLANTANIITNIYTELWAKVTTNVTLLSVEKMVLKTATIANLIRAINWHNTKWAKPFIELPHQLLKIQAGKTTPSYSTARIIACLGTIAPQGTNLWVINEKVQAWKVKMTQNIDLSETDNFVSWRSNINNVPEYALNFAPTVIQKIHKQKKERINSVNCTMQEPIPQVYLDREPTKHYQAKTVKLRTFQNSSNPSTATLSEKRQISETQLIDSTDRIPNLSNYPNNQHCK